MQGCSFNTLPTNKILVKAKLKAMVLIKTGETKLIYIVLVVFDMVENIGKQYFRLLPQCFQKPSSSLEGC